jgi:hypothetical protein
MSDEPQNDLPADELDEDMPEPETAPCGDIYGVHDGVHVTDADQAGS